MTHPTHEQWMEYLYGELDSGEQAELETHLQKCSECRENVNSWQNVLAELDKWKLPNARRPSMPHRAIGWVGRWAVAAVLLIVIGFGVGRFSGPDPPDLQQVRAALETSIKSSIEPTVRQNIIEELTPQLQVALADSYAQLKNELIQQFRQDLNASAVQTLAASGAITNQLLTELIGAINTAQNRDRHWITAALDQMELNRLRDDTQLKNELVTFAAYTTDELYQTKQDLANLIAYGRADNLVPAESENLNTTN